jgi:hypothetical protein
MTTFSGKVRRAVEKVKAAAVVVRDRVVTGLGVARLKAGEVRRRVTVAVAEVKEFVDREFPEADRQAAAAALRSGAVAVREKAKVLGRVVAARAAAAGEAAGRRVARAAGAVRRVAVAAAQDAAGDFGPALRRAGPEAVAFGTWVGRGLARLGRGVAWFARGAWVVVTSIDWSNDPYDAAAKAGPPGRPVAVPFEGPADEVRRAA